MKNVGISIHLMVINILVNGSKSKINANKKNVLHILNQIVSHIDKIVI